MIAPMTLPIIYEDNHLFGVNKPAGLSVHKTHPEDPNETLADILVQERPYLIGVGEDKLRPGVVHRLDKATSGIMIIAKNQEAFESLKRQFQERTVRKEYLALIHGRPKQSHGKIDMPLGKVGTRQTTQLHGRRDLAVREALTEYEVARSFEDFTLLRVVPRTGRTHQIRVHLDAIGLPIAGDPDYGPKRVRLPEGLGRMFLHAERLELASPDGTRLALEAELPSPLQKVLDSLQ
jgi:23S rRNA pseudouridine1911/1915/1917 synthase